MSQTEKSTIAAAPAPAPAAEGALVVDKPRRLIVDSTVPVLDTGMYEQMLRVAKVMANAGLVPVHLNRVKRVDGRDVTMEPDEAIANCFLVVNQSVRWKMDPFAVAQHTFVTSGKIGYEGKLVAAVVNTHPGLETRLAYRYEGQGDTRTVTVTGKLRGDSEERHVTGYVAQWRTTDREGNVKEAWRKQPDQMLAYRGAREWARRWMPEAILGVYAEEEIETIESEAAAAAVTPEKGAGSALRGALGIGSSTAPAPEPEKPEPEKKPEPKKVPEKSPVTERGSDVKGFIEKLTDELAKCTDTEMVRLVAEGYPESARVHDEFSKAVRKRLADLGEQSGKPEEIADPKAKKAGTPKMRKEFVERMSKCKTTAGLDTVIAEALTHIWGKEDAEALENTYKNLFATVATKS